MKLEGIRVVDLSVFLPGPYLTMCMADHGAEVIKVERPGEGDPGRQIGERDGASTVFFRNVNRGKRSVTLNLKNEADRERLLKLVANADVFIESFRPGVMKRLGLDYTALSTVNEKLIYCSISAFGQNGPYRLRPAHDLAVQALAGMSSITLGDDGSPAIPGIAAADIVSALHGLSGVLMALHRRHSTGCGDYIDISMQDAMLAAGPNILGPTFAENRQPVVHEERTLGGSALYRIYPTSDNRHLVLAGQEPKFVVSLLTDLERTDLVPFCTSGPGRHQEPVIEFLRQTFLTKTLAEWTEWLEGREICYAPVKTLPEALEDPQFKTRATITVDVTGRKQIAPVVRYQLEPAIPNWTEPTLGEGNEKFLS